MDPLLDIVEGLRLMFGDAGALAFIVSLVYLSILMFEDKE